MTEKVLYIGTWSMSYKFLVDFKFVREHNFESQNLYHFGPQISDDVTREFKNTSERHIFKIKFIEKMANDPKFITNFLQDIFLTKILFSDFEIMKIFTKASG